jgi:hypothetical protein
MRARAESGCLRGSSFEKFGQLLLAFFPTAGTRPDLFQTTFGEVYYA